MTLRLSSYPLNETFTLKVQQNAESHTEDHQEKNQSYLQASKYTKTGVLYRCQSIFACLILSKARFDIPRFPPTVLAWQKCRFTAFVMSGDLANRTCEATYTILGLLIGFHLILDKKLSLNVMLFLRASCHSELVQCSFCNLQDVICSDILFL